MLDNYYQNILEELKTGKRPRVELKDDLREALFQRWRQVLDEHSRPNDILPVLCILDHARGPTGEYHQLIVETLNSPPGADKDILIHTLGISRQHVINYYQLRGDPLPHDYINALKKLLGQQQDAEILEWVLRLIESTGGQSLKFRKEIMERKPGLLEIFNKHKKASRQIIQLLEKRWASYGF